MGKIQYDKKQLPQVVVLGVISLCLFGYGAAHLLTPPPLEAKQAPKAAVASLPQTMSKETVASSTVPPTLFDQAPDARSRDPFVVPSAPPNPDVKPEATVKPLAPPPPPPKQMAALPTLGSLMPLNVPKLPVPSPFKPVTAVRNTSKDVSPVTAGSGWQLTGVIGNDADAGSLIAVLRRGDEHRFVHVGEQLEPDVRVVAIMRGQVIIKSAGGRHTIKLGGSDAPASSLPVSPGGGPVPLPPGIPDESG